MPNEISAPPTEVSHPDHILVVFGATGDMATTKLLPAFVKAYRDDSLLPNVRLICVAKEHPTQIVRTLLTAFSSNAHEGRQGVTTTNGFSQFRADLHFQALQIDLERWGLDSAYETLKSTLDTYMVNGERPSITYYIATPPRLYNTIAFNLAGYGILHGSKRAIVLEKPYGESYDQVKALFDFLSQAPDGQEAVKMYLIDHYLFKPMSRRILSFRRKMATDCEYKDLRAVWNREHVDHIEITVAEAKGIENRGNFFDETGTLSDMVQNHLLQLVCLVTARPHRIQNREEDYVYDIIGDATVDILEGISDRLQQNTRPVSEWMALGQYDGYHDEPDVAPDSETETFAALTLELGNGDWEGVPCWIRTGKFMSTRSAAIVIEFKNHERITFHIQPHQRIVVRLQSEDSPLVVLLDEEDALTEDEDANLDLPYRGDSGDETDDAYVHVILQVLYRELSGNVLTEWVLQSWDLMTELRERIENAPSDITFPYERGADGPVQEVNRLIESPGQGRHWLSLQPSKPL